MGAFDNNERTIIIPRTPEEREKWGWDPHESVECRVVPTMADHEYVDNEVIKAVAPRKGKGKGKGKTLDVQSQLGLAKRLWLYRMIKSWTFTKNGMPVPVSLDSIRLLPSWYADHIYDAIMEEQPDDDDEDGEGEDEEGEENSDSFFSDASAPIEEEAHEQPTPKNHLSPLK